jgi:hypothetical protein
MAPTSAPQTRYLCNPDVVLREEDEDGGLLFNPDTSQVKVVNTTGLFIWKQFGTAAQLETVAEALLKNFEEVPIQEFRQDLNEFLEDMIQSGFIGSVEGK